MAILLKITSVILNYGEYLPVTYKKRYSEYSGFFFIFGKTVQIDHSAFAWRLVIFKKSLKV